jgi:putative DNA primase/helicase
MTDEAIPFEEYKRLQRAEKREGMELNPHAEEALKELAGLSPIQFARKREGLASQLNVPVTFLDREYNERRKKRSGSERTAERAHWTVEPWHEPVDGADLVDQIVRRLKRHVVMEDEAALAAALWIVFAWVHEAAVHSAILLVSSPEAECGKTTLLALISFLVPKGIIIVEVSPAVLFRMIEQWHPVLIVDEADNAFKNNPELRAVVNAGWTRGAGVPRCNPETNEPEFFETFGAKAIGLKGLNVPDTTLSRAIIIEMQRKLPEDQAEDFAHADDEELARLRQQLSRFALDNMAPLRAHRARLPDGFSNRLAANCRLMLAIADLCGPITAEKARAAAVHLSRRSDDASLGVELLRDIRELFSSGSLDRLGSKDLVNELIGMEERPWVEMPFTGRPINQAGVARLLKPYGVKPAQVRFGESTRKGYMLTWFNKAFRYIPNKEEDPSGRGNSETTADFRQKRRNIPRPNVSAKTAENSQCFDVSGNQRDLGDQDKPACSDAAVAFGERAASLEYDGGMPRAEAEAQAAAEMPDLPDFLRRVK